MRRYACLRWYERRMKRREKSRLKDFSHPLLPARFRGNKVKFCSFRAVETTRTGFEKPRSSLAKWYMRDTVLEMRVKLCARNAILNRRTQYAINRSTSTILLYNRVYNFVITFPMAFQQQSIFHQLTIPLSLPSQPSLPKPLYAPIN